MMMTTKADVVTFYTRKKYKGLIFAVNISMAKLPFRLHHSGAAFQTTYRSLCICFDEDEFGEWRSDERRCESAVVVPLLAFLVF